MLILASKSPRRALLLALTGWNFSIRADEVDEQVLPGESAQGYVLRMAQSKALAVRERLGSYAGAGTFIIAADTAVVDDSPSQMTVSRRTAALPPDEEILGKPADEREAWSMLHRLGGRSHHVYTGLAVLRISDGEMLSDVHVTEVRMRDYDDEEIRAYIESGDPMDKAGAYAIQHPGFQPVESLDGCYANVMGLPVCRLASMLSTCGIHPKTDVVTGCQEALDHQCLVFKQVTGQI